MVELIQHEKIQELVVYHRHGLISFLTLLHGVRQILNSKVIDIKLLGGIDYAIIS